MKLFVAYTGMQLLNILNLRANTLCDDIADLYIADIPRMPKDLIELAKKSNYFRKVALIALFDIHEDIKLQNYPFLLKKGLYYIQSIFKTKYYQREIHDNFGNSTYDEIITQGFWLDSIFIVRACYLKNNAIKISLVEEGTSAWDRSFEWFTNQIVTYNYSSRSAFIWKLRWLLETGHTFNHDLVIYQKLIEKFYLYVPSLSLVCNENNLIGCTIPAIDENNKFLLKLMQLGSAIDISEMNIRKIIVFVYTEGIIDDSVHTCFINHILSQLLKKWKPTDIVLKAHPAFSLNEAYYLEKYPGIFIDNRKYQLETIIPRLNLDDKILITRASTSVYSPKYMFNLEPYVIFTDLLFPNNMRLNADLSKMVSDLKSKYQNTERVMLPHTFEEFNKYI